MNNKLMPLFDKLLLRKRAIIETAIDQLKNIGQIEHSRHRGVLNYFADIIAGLPQFDRCMLLVGGQRPYKKEMLKHLLLRNLQGVEQLGSLSP
jgi:hypothetical protein